MPQNIHLSAAAKRQVLLKNWRLLLAASAISLVFTVLFWQSQLVHYLHQTQGVVFMWLVAGLLFLLVQMSLQFEAWHKARGELSTAHRFEVSWSLGVQLFIFAVATVYNVVALIELLALGVQPTNIFDLLIGLILLCTAAVVLVLYRRAPTSPAARLAIATGTKAAPQLLQAGALAVLGSGGLPPVTIGAITAMGGLRYVLAHHAYTQYASGATVAANKAAFRDFASILVMAIGWAVGTMR